MLYTIKDLYDVIEGLKDTRYVGISVDGDFKGVALVSDLTEQVYGFDRSGKRRIKQIFLSGVTYDVKKGLNIYPISTDQFWEEIGHRECRNSIQESTNKSKPISNININKENSVSSFEEPLVRWDSSTGIIHIRDGKVIQKKKTSHLGLIQRFKRWLKGDKGYMR